MEAQTTDVSRRVRSGSLRRHWGLARGVAFLNHGSFGACPKPILKLQSELRAQMEAEPVQFLWRRYEERLEPSRRVLAEFIGARPQDTVFVTNATTAVNAVARSAGLREGDEILTTNLDYNACRNALAQAAADVGVTVRAVEAPFPLRRAEELIEAVLRAVSPRTRLAMIDHVTSSTGLVLPVERLVRELEARGVDTLVDGAHAPGMLPLDLSALRPAYYTGNLHKWVCAPKGAAFLWAREDKQASLQPCVVSHGNNTPRPGFSPFQDRFDWAGTNDPTAWMCVGETIRWMGALLPGGWPEVQQRNRELALSARRMLCRGLGLEAPCPESMIGSLATLPLPERFQSEPRSGKIDAEQLRLYDEYRIEVPFYWFGSPERRYFRISAQLYNRMGDYRRLALGLEMI